MISQQRTFEILNKAKYGDKPSQFFDFFLSFLILANLAAVCLESVKSINESFYIYFLYFEYFSVIVFSLEYILRIWSQAVNKNSLSKTIFGRRRYLREINARNAMLRGFAERNAINAPIQGSAADIIKVAMINIHQEMFFLSY